MADRSRVDLVMRDYRLSRPDAAAVVMLSASLHFGERDIVRYARDCGRSVRDVGPAFVISYYTDDPVDYVWDHRRGRSWRDYGDDQGMNWDRFNRLRISYSDFDRMIWMNLSDLAYGCDEPLWDDYGRQGFSFTDIVLVIVLGDGHRDRCDRYAYEYRRNDRDWGRVWPVIGPDWRSFERNRSDTWRSDDRQRGSSRDSQYQRDRDRQLQDQRDRDRRLQDQRDRDRQVQDQRDRQNRDRQLQEQRDRDRQVQDQRDRQNRDRQLQDQKDRQNRDRQLQDQRDRQNRDRQLQDQRDRQNRDRQLQDQKDRQNRDRQLQDQKDRQNRDRQLQDQKDRENRDRGNDKGGRDRGGDDKGGRDRGNGGGGGRDRGGR
jgi:hypothetical protein